MEIKAWICPTCGYIMSDDEYLRAVCDACLRCGCSLKKFKSVNLNELTGKITKKGVE